MNEINPTRLSFAFYWSFKDAINSIPTDKEKLEIYEAITDFAFLGKEPELSPFGKAMWKLIKPNLIASMARYDQCVENGKKGAVHGKKGGRPRKEKPQEKPQEKPHNVDVDDNVNVNANYNNKFNKFTEFGVAGKGLTDKKIIFLPSYR